MIPPAPILDVYYASTCVPCRLELPVLAQAVQDGLPVTVVVLTEEARARRELAAVSPGLEAAAVAAPAATDPRATLRAAGDPDGILPFSVARRPDGRACRTWRGSLTLDRIRRLLASCGL
ncbi:MAG: hypothetical protein M0006_00415 [Magnetospirillum sp.]|nr:hypothetical protein [Magnetospirillum sp.]